jgi:hypothetical protein
VEKYKKSKQDLYAALKRHKRLQDRLDRMESRALHDQDQKDIRSILLQLVKGGHVPDETVHGLPMALLWQDQLKRIQNPRAPYHPMIILWALNMYQSSSSGYERLAKAGFLRLPSGSTLKRYVRTVQQHTGLVPAHLISIKEAAAARGIFDEKLVFRREVSLFWDEIYVDAALEWDQCTGKLVGFCDSFDFTQLDEGIRKLSSRVLQFMIRVCVGPSFVAPVCYYSFHTAGSIRLKDHVMEVIIALHNMGFKVVICVCDGAGDNRRFIKECMQEVGLAPREDDPSMCKTPTMRNSVDGSAIAIMTDVPHMLKKLRNILLSSSFTGSATRALFREGQEVGWHHILKLYNRERNIPVRTVRKLHKAEVMPSTWERMRVSSAAHVLSKNVALQLQQMAEEGVLQSTMTAAFCRAANDWFDILNSDQPVKSPDDPRMQQLVEHAAFFLKWRVGFEAGNAPAAMPQHLRGKPGSWKPAARSMFDLAVATFGFKAFVDGFFERHEYLKGRCGPIPRRLNQDALESWFGAIRQMGRAATNPTVNDYGLRVQANWVKGIARFAQKGNVGGANEGAQQDAAIPAALVVHGRVVGWRQATKNVGSSHA